MISNLRVSIATYLDCIPLHHLVALLISKFRISIAQYSDCNTSHSPCCYLDFDLSISRFRLSQSAIRFSTSRFRTSLRCLITIPIATAFPHIALRLPCTRYSLTDVFRFRAVALEMLSHFVSALRRPCVEPTMKSWARRARCVA